MFAVKTPAMIFRSIFIFIIMFSLAGCLGVEHKDHSKKPGKKTKPDMPDQSQDTSFQAFLGRLRTAAKTRDLATLASMMTSNFGYAINPDREGDGVFQYWDEKDLWKEIELVLSEKFVPLENYMVAPPQFAHRRRGLALR